MSDFDREPTGRRGSKASAGKKRGRSDRVAAGMRIMTMILNTMMNSVMTNRMMMIMTMKRIVRA
ncbi:TPA: hypothetical protein OTU18_000584 [Morganella morganii]|nr:hypothetical protein [Morganella morganii]